MILPFLLVLSLGCSRGGGGVHLNRVYFLTETLYLALCIYKSTSVFLKKKNSDQSYKHTVHRKIQMVLEYVKIALSHREMQIKLTQVSSQTDKTQEVV